MSIQTALDFGAEDRTWNMIANMRYPFGSGIIEVADETQRGHITQAVEDEGTGVITIAPFSIITSQGVVIWDEETNEVLAGTNGTFYISLYASRGTDSPLTYNFSSSTTLPNNSDYIVFGMVTIESGVLTLVNYDNKNSIAQVGHGKFKGIVSSLPDLDTDDDINDSQAGAEIQTGDIFITVSATKAYLHVADRDNKTYRVLTIDSTHTEQNSWGDGARRITLNGTTGIVTVGASDNLITLDSTDGQVTSKTLRAIGTMMSSRVNSSNLRAYDNDTEIIFGRAEDDEWGGNSNISLVPVVNNTSFIGSPARYFNCGYFNSLISKSIIARDINSSVGSSARSFSGVYTKALLNAQEGMDIACVTLKPVNEAPSLGLSTLPWNNAHITNSRVTNYMNTSGATLGKINHINIIGLDEAVTDGIGIAFNGGDPATITREGSFVAYTWLGAKTILVQSSILINCDTTGTSGIYIIPKGTLAWLKPNITDAITDGVQNVGISFDNDIEKEVAIHVTTMSNMGGCIGAYSFDIGTDLIKHRIQFSIIYECVGPVV